MPAAVPAAGAAVPAATPALCITGGRVNIADGKKFLDLVWRFFAPFCASAGAGRAGLGLYKFSMMLRIVPS